MRAELRDNGELRAYVFRISVGEPLLATRTEDFFLIDNGSIVLGAVTGNTPALLGVNSLLPGGKKGCRLLLGMAVGVPWCLDGTVDGRDGLEIAS